MTSHADVFDAYSHYYDLLYRDKDYAAEASYVDGLLRRHGVAGRRLLEFGSGTGRHGRELGELGYFVTGIERSAEMVALAEQTEGFRCRQGDICDTHLGETFAAVLSLFHVVSYQVTNSDVQAVFAGAAEHLLTGGLFVFDVWYTAAVCSHRPEVRIKRMSDGTTDITRIAEPVVYANEDRVDVCYTIFARDLSSGAVQALVETHPMRHFSLPELDLLAEASGFERVAAEEFLTGNDPGEDTWGVCLVFRKV